VCLDKFGAEQLARTNHAATSEAGSPPEPRLVRRNAADPSSARAWLSALSVRTPRVHVRIGAKALGVTRPFVVPALSRSRFFRPDKALHVAGLVTHTICSEAFVSGLAPAEACSQSIAPYGF
jgi:hypothetical protein